MGPHNGAARDGDGVNIEVALCLPRDAASVAVVRDVTMAALMQLGVDVECVDDIRLAVSEASANVIEHAGAGDEYEVRLDITEKVCEIRVLDSGHGFDFESLGDEMPDPMSPRGRGLALMHALVDGVDFVSAPESGTVVRLVKWLEFGPGSPLGRLRDLTGG
jgi:serine/threonine-protein kinase RsbW